MREQEVLRQIKAGVDAFNEDMKAQGKTARAGYPASVQIYNQPPNPAPESATPPPSGD